MKKLLAGGILATLPIGFFATIYAVNGLMMMMAVFTAIIGIVLVAFALAWAVGTLS